MSKMGKAADRVAGEVDKEPYSEIRIWFHDPQTMTFKGITIKPSQLPFKVKDSDGTEYNIKMEHQSRLFYYDWKLKRMKFNIYYLLRLFDPSRKTGVTIMEYGNPDPITHINHKPEFTDETPQSLWIDVKEIRYAAFLKSLIARGLANRKIIIIIAVIVIIAVAVYLMFGSGFIK